MGISNEIFSVLKNLLLDKTRHKYDKKSTWNISRKKLGRISVNYSYYLMNYCDIYADLNTTGDNEKQARKMRSNWLIMIFTENMCRSNSTAEQNILIKNEQTAFEFSNFYVRPSEAARDNRISSPKERAVTKITETMQIYV